jgi:hypothetical protein
MGLDATQFALVLCLGREFGIAEANWTVAANCGPTDSPTLTVTGTP